MIVYLLDTNILSYALKPQYTGLKARLEVAMLGNEVAISAVTRAEIRAGQRRMEPQDKRRPLIDKLLGTIATLDWTSRAADIYGEVHAYLTSCGQPIGILDTQIAAHALAARLTMVTHNTRHFERIPGLMLEDWMV